MRLTPGISACCRGKEDEKTAEMQFGHFRGQSLSKTTSEPNKSNIQEIYSDHMALIAQML